jgi:preprotein translocase subunit SecE
MAKTNPAQFIQEVRQEANKVTWPTRKESGISTVMVFVMVIVFAIFFMVVDWALQLGVKAVLGVGG